MRQVIVRTTCAVFAGVPPLAAFTSFVLMIILGDPMPGEFSVGESIFTPAAILTFFVTVPCGYVAFKGIGSPKDNSFRIKYISQTVIGVLCVVFGFLLTYLSTLLPIVFFLFSGLIATGMVTCMLGVLSLVSDRELLNEMSQIDVSFGKRKSD